ncbi:probable RO-10 protein, required for nuclear distribution [Rhynchosporium secalis]|uniref:Probable RO-10 protein, required for nuclear distribution n=1 Tax=Rhynchosporium secalis TaxID=38038 RepID=A0A1E1LU95_RHYSE|nr:probable RO-10 protein, required for nuclear distribution [Rhynchosporium secalis]
MQNTFDQTATETIDLLEARLRRIEFAIYGQVEQIPSSNNAPSATQRLASLEHSLHQLASKSRAIQELLKLHSKHPDLFQSPSPRDPPTTLDSSTILSIILSSASSYPSTSSRLTSIMDVPIPAAELSTQLIELQPRIAKIEAVQAAQNEDIKELRERSAKLVQKWYLGDILGAGEEWAGYEGRVGRVEQRLRRVVKARRTDDAMI